MGQFWSVEIQRGTVFIVTSNNTTINPTTLPNALFMIGSETISGHGSLRITPLSTSPNELSGLPSSPDRGYPDITQLNYWGAVVVQGTATGFAMEFIGDGHDSTAFTTPNFSGLN